MGILTFLKVLVGVLVAALLTVFYIQNTGPAPIQFPFTRIFHMPLMFMLLAAYVAGIVTALFGAFWLGARMKKHNEEEDPDEQLVEEE
ncbi:MAG: DUF1049 domain-containing protein [Candidatus Omnitrophica bacterium]|nr:DUF1049 domain-containing protein [Candidatus Omnitrophota bacterium]